MKRHVILCTGGIGSGKSVVVRTLNELGVPSYDCDRSAKELYDRDPQLLADVVRITDPGVLDATGRLDRAALAERIFRDGDLLRKVEELVHPAVVRDFAAWLDARPEPVAVIESAILLEKPQFAPMYDSVLVVTAPEEVRIARVMARDGVSEAQVRRRMALQWSDERRIACADFVLENNDRQAILPALLNMLAKISEDGKN